MNFCLLMVGLWRRWLIRVLFFDNIRGCPSCQAAHDGQDPKLATIGSTASSAVEDDINVNIAHRRRVARSEGHIQAGSLVEKPIRRVEHPPSPCHKRAFRMWA